MIGKFFARERRLAQQGKEILRMRNEMERLHAQNESLRTAMRRCTTCDYRLMAKDESVREASEETLLPLLRG